jgi:hypothetical protein
MPGFKKNQENKNIIVTKEYLPCPHRRGNHKSHRKNTSQEQHCNRRQLKQMPSKF